MKKLLLILAILLFSCNSEREPKKCETYKYKIDVCMNCFNAWFYTDSIRWENNMIVATDEDGRKRMLRPIEIEEGNFEVCK